MSGFDSRVCPWCDSIDSGKRCPKCGSSLVDVNEIEPEGTHSFSSKYLSVRYRVLKYLGEGGMGAVYKAYDHSSDQMVAVKFLLPKLTLDPRVRSEYYGRFTTECQILARLRSPYIVGFVDHEQAPDGTPALVMELLNGFTLQDLLDRERHLDLHQIVDIAVPVCRALQLAHCQGYVHRDLKPSNIFLHNRGDGFLVVKVVDFGVAKVLHDGMLRTMASASPIGTDPYMSPEQCQQENLTHKSDLFSLGIMLYQMASGRLPFRGRTRFEVWESIILKEKAPFELSLKVPQALEDLIDRLLQKNPDDRLNDAAEVERMLLEACMEVPADTVRLSEDDLLWLNSERNRTRVIGQDQSQWPNLNHVGGTDQGSRPNQTSDSVQLSPWSDIPSNAQPVFDTWDDRPISNQAVKRQPEAPVVSTEDEERLRSVLAASSGRQGKWKLPVVLAAVLVILLLGWWVYSLASISSIGVIKNDCLEMAFDEVKISGSVISSVSVPLTDISAYKVSDSDDKIWVLSSMTPPDDGDSVTITGIVVQAEAWDYICKEDDPPDNCQIVAAAMGIAGDCIILELRR